MSKESLLLHSTGFGRPWAPFLDLLGIYQHVISSLLTLLIFLILPYLLKASQDQAAHSPLCHCYASLHCTPTAGGQQRDVSE